MDIDDFAYSLSELVKEKRILEWENKVMKAAIKETMVETEKNFFDPKIHLALIKNRLSKVIHEIENERL